ncbi:DUF3618 domain-containing protein [Rhodococcoides corynebacterioides]|uniref:DUF3618 domain-containing protein n=1 Tax=Rhodococcoides corynebacterioides TaxID=53972 RepID=A0ABS7P6N9_9NOCA|nr:DUF3618 domain-containing protein [Rhodococcus corynebacterioides]MBY6368088.1 DUF3618 domain-containing protein [Rhodococcus corynebacterioides]MBY6406528.1 DUF3618 domain-containing protein [Rhodococcus corynebacterioides]
MTESREPKHALPEDTPPPVEQQREELAQTVEALAAKVDVPARVSAATREQTEKAQELAREGVSAVKENPQTAGLSLAGVAGALLLVFVIRRRRTRKERRVLA